jgi:hypothetical protein
MVTRRLPLLVAVVGAGCVSSRQPLRLDNGPHASAVVTVSCDSCSAEKPDSGVASAIEKRVAELKARGGACSVYGAVLETSYRSGQITIRPYMWRVGGQLASGEAKPNGEMVLAREIDSLNVGVRTMDDLLWTMEHEAAHIAFHITNGVDAGADRANQHVRACKEPGSSGPVSLDRQYQQLTNRPRSH